MTSFAMEQIFLAGCRILLGMYPKYEIESKKKSSVSARLAPQMIASEATRVEETLSCQRVNTRDTYIYTYAVDRDIPRKHSTT